jgi:outer membrane protein TolC
MIRFKWSVLALLLCGLLPQRAAAQETVSIDDCYRLARENYPLIKKQDLLSRSRTYSLQNAARMYLPQVSVSGQASYQSETVGFPDVFSGLPVQVSLPAISKDQYRIQADLSQVIYDGGNISNQRAMIRAGNDVSQQQVEVNLYAIRDRVNQVYFSVLLMDEQLKQNEIKKSNLQNVVTKAEAALANGAAFRSSVNELKAEVVNAEMASIEYRASRKAYLDMLGMLIGRELEDSTRLTMPASAATNKEMNRPELRLYDLQQYMNDVEKRKLRTDYLPKLSAFVTGAYGRPTLNIINNEFGPWYIVGARLNWNLGSLYTVQNSRRNIELNRQGIETDRETFVFNTNLSLTQEAANEGKYKALLQQDQEAVALRESVKKSAEAQLENGVITVHDFIAQVNAENLARQQLILHRILLVQSQYKQHFTAGN